MGKLTAGTKIPCRVCRTLDVGDFSILHQLTWFNMAIHSNAEYAKGTWFKERSLAGPIIFAVADGLVHHADTVAELLAQDGYEIHAYVGVNDVKITAPVLFGDTLRADAEVIWGHAPGRCRSGRPSRHQKPGAVLVRLRK